MNRIEMAPSTDGPVFSDPNHRRARVAGFVVAALASAVIAWFAYFVVSIYALEETLSFRAERLAHDSGLPIVESALVAHGSSPGQDSLSFECEITTDCWSFDNTNELEFTSYLQVFPDGAVNSITSSSAQLAGVAADWFRADIRTGEIEITGSARILGALRELGRGTGDSAFSLQGVSALPLYAIGEPFTDEDALPLERTAAGLADMADEFGLDRICVRPEGYRSHHLALIRKLVAELTLKLEAAGVESCLVAEATGPLWRDTELVAAANRILLQAFRLPETHTKPAPLAPQLWFEETLAEALETVGADKLIPAIGTFGMQWQGDRPEPEIIGFGDAMLSASSRDGSIRLPEDSLNTQIKFVDRAGLNNEIWMLDALAVRNQVSWLQKNGVREVVFWGTGYEDPGMWELLSAPALPVTGFYQDLILENTVAFSGNGSFFRLDQPAVAGRRFLSLDPDTGRVNRQEYERLPSPVLLERYGASEERLFVLTFDDGPDPEFTTSILDTLRDKGVPATFFLIGSNVARNPQLVRRIVAEGHEIGSHTFFHPATDRISDTRLEFELDVMQRLLVSTTGHGTRLFRAPYGSSEGPVTLEETQSLMRIQQSGYLIAGADIVTRDWEGLSKNGIVQDVIAQLDPDAGSQVLVLHDAGGDRQPTVDALPELIDRLRALGYRFASLHELLGVERDDVQPPLVSLWSQIDGASFAFIAWAGKAVQWLFWIAIAAGLLRSCIILILAHVRRPHVGSAEEQGTPVTILIPAFNEEDSIAESVKRALAADYEPLSVIVIDDGSSDRTAEIVGEIAWNEPRLMLIRQENRGKWRALDTAYRLVDSEIVVAIDGDTRLASDAVALLVRHFSDPSVGAVAGNVRVENRSGLLARLQALEYVTSQNIDRRAAELLDAILVVPGAIGAWRTEAVRKAGFYVNDTVAEDADLTVAVHRAGYRVVFDEGAMSFTRVPEKTSVFMRQRLRWMFGMMQTAWKHRAAASESRTIGLIAIPDLWFFGITFGLLAPLADLVFLALLADMAAGSILGKAALLTNTETWMLIGYLALPGIDLLTTMLALRFERSESKWMVFLLPFRRLIYRPLLYVTVYRAVWRAVFGRLVNWGRVLRSEPVGPS